MPRTGLDAIVRRSAGAALLLLLGACATPERTPGVAWLLGATALSTIGVSPHPSDFYEAPVQVSDTLELTAIAAGGDHTCALDSGGAAYCWGSNQYQQLGTAAPRQACASGVPCSPAPVRLEGAPRLTALAATLWGTCGLDIAGRAHCWGYGAGSAGSALAEVASDEPFVALASSAAGNDTCALGRSGTAWCWSAGSWQPSRVPGTFGLVALAFSGTHGCGIDAVRAAACWGNNEFGQLGVGSSGVGGGLSESAAPLAVRGGLEFSAIAVAAGYSCGLTPEGSPHCWGSSFGAGVAVSARPDPRGLRHSTLPVQVAARGRAFAALAAGTTQACMLGGDGELDCFATVPTRRGPPDLERLASDEKFVAVTIGGQHGCALGADAFAYCWGLNRLGQVGRAPTGKRVR